MTFTDPPARSRPTVGQAGRYAADLVERIAATFVMTFLSALVAANWFSLDQIRDLSVVQDAGVAGIAAVLSLIKGLIAKAVSKPDSASLAPGV